MRYVGGKSRHAKEIAKVINPRGVWWDPFCGGFAMSAALSKYGPGIASDAHPALYLAIVDGWDPPRTMSAEEYARAKTLPDSDPLKAFAGFGCSFGGKWFGGRAKDAPKSNPADFPARAASDLLIRDVRGSCIAIAHIDFFEIAPRPGLTLYLDPPYAGTQGYATGAFDHARFWALAQRCATLGPVFVSEYVCPVPHRVVWSKSVTSALQGGAKANDRIERLFALHSLDETDRHGEGSDQGSPP